MHPHVFKVKLLHWFCNKKSILSSLEFLDLFQLLDLDNKVYNTLFMCLPNQLLHCHFHNKNSNIKKFYHVVSRFVFEHAIFSSFPSLFIQCHFLDSYLLCLDTWIFFRPIFQIYIIHTYFNCFIIPTYHIFICKILFDC
jgi:hypothetical protein